MAQERNDRLVRDAEGRETDVKRQSVHEILLTGSFKEVLWGVIDPLLRDIYDPSDNPHLFQQLAAGDVGLEALDFVSDDGGVRLQGETIAQSIRFIDAVTRVRFPAYDVFNPKPSDPSGQLTEGQIAGKQAAGLVAFYSAPGDIALVFNSFFTGNPPIDG